MAPTRVVVLSSRSLFAEGIASRLRQHLEMQEILIVDSRTAEALRQVIEAQPAAVIIDATEDEITQPSVLESLLSALPELTIIRLGLEHDQAQVVTSQQRSVGQMHDLIALVQSAAGSDSAAPV